ncbi:ArnT family glycosyltransferase [Azospirillum griseum]|uniref:Glycosyltransferase RgtA/B/C/D-like domain-containing protein n=1 Tax=Azospirillum griseum TaxID=2496639 RepID=A0A3S0I2W3_9PROT|nr:hypothetical protein [Azospirillum griseum]RTR22559.1 hypothetical protein EJ903_07030 [Azospirillum griseum]
MTTTALFHARPIRKGWILLSTALIALSRRVETHRFIPWAALFGLVLVVLGYGLSIRPIQPTADSISYLSGAYHLHAHGVYSGAPTDDVAPPSIGREPGYPLVLAMLMRIDPAFGGFRPSCLMQANLCDSAIYRIPQWVNAVLIGVSGLALFATLHRLTRRRIPSLLGALYLVANLQMHKGFYDIISDPLAVSLVAILLWLLVRAWQSPDSSLLRWAWVGLGAAALTFTKAIFLYFALVGLACAALVGLFHPIARRRLFPALLVAALTFAAPIGGWVMRNTSIIGVPVFTDLRSGIALSTREVFNHMSAEQYAAAFVYWTRGFGDGLAKRLFAPEVIAPFDLGQPGGFYDEGQNGYGRRLATLEQAEGLSELAAVKQLDRQLINAILDRPLIHLATTLPVLYRGIWIDEFIVVGLPVFMIVLIGAVRRRDALTITLLGLGAFNLLFYALISLNITRYQMTAVPCIALACGLAAHRWLNRHGFGQRAGE